MREKIVGLSRWMDCNTPPGFPWRSMVKGVLWAELLSVLWSLTFFIGYVDRYNALFENVYVGEKTLEQGAVMVDFDVLITGRMMGFFAVVAAALGIAASHYFYYFQGSKSIYLMKRLPRKSELWRRCLALPAVIVVFSLGMAFLLTLIYFFIYMRVTPQDCLTANQWAKLWSIGTAG